jgi:ABC-2 type transport system permease protein
MTVMQLGLFGVAFTFVQFKRTGALRRLFATPTAPGYELDRARTRPKPK